MVKIFNKKLLISGFQSFQRYGNASKKVSLRTEVAKGGQRRPKVNHHRGIKKFCHFFTRGIVLSFFNARKYKFKLSFTKIHN